MAISNKSLKEYTALQTKNGVLYHGNCLNVMKLIKPRSIDMILCDLPYGTTNCSWDSVIPFDRLWKRYDRVIKPNGAIVLTAAQPFTAALVMSNIEIYRQHLIWEKTSPTNFLNAKKMFMKWHEDILIFYKELPTFNPQMTTCKRSVSKVTQKPNRSEGVFGATGEKAGYRYDNNGLAYPKSILQHSTDSSKIHPTQKPVELFEFLIKTYTDKGQTVLDNCSGSGTTAEACELTDRKWICIEKEQKYIDISVKRLKKWNSKLF